MGYQLWTSPTTGYRRKGTRLSELRSVLGVGVIARTILEPLQCCPLDAPAGEMRRILELRGFDVAGVQENKGGPVVGFVTRATLNEGTIRDQVNPIYAEHLISESTPLNGLLTVLAKREHAFVLFGSEVSGIVTLADLNKPPVRVYLFGLISLLEMHLTFWTGKFYPDDSWQQELKADRLDAAAKLQLERHKRNEDIKLLDCLQFCDKRDLVLAKAELRTKLGFTSKNGTDKLLKNAEEIRNALAHSQSDLAGGTSWKEVIKLTNDIESLVHKSDDAVEEAAKSAKKSVDELWVAG